MNLNMKHIFLFVFIIFVVLTLIIGINHTHEKNQKIPSENTNESLTNFHGNISLMWTTRGENFSYCNDSILVPEDSMVKVLSMENGTVEKQLTVSEYYFLDNFMFLRINGSIIRLNVPAESSLDYQHLCLNLTDGR